MGCNTATDGKNTQNAYTKMKHYTIYDLTYLKDRSCSDILGNNAYNTRQTDLCGIPIIIQHITREAMHIQCKVCDMWCILAQLMYHRMGLQAS